MALRLPRESRAAPDVEELRRLPSGAPSCVMRIELDADADDRGRGEDGERLHRVDGRWVPEPKPKPKPKRRRRKKGESGVEFDRLARELAQEHRFEQNGNGNGATPTTDEDELMYGYEPRPREGALEPLNERMRIRQALSDSRRRNRRLGDSSARVARSLEEG